MATVSRIPYQIEPINTDWQLLEFAEGLLKNRPGPITIEVTTGTFHFDRVDSQDPPSNTTNSPQYSASGTTKLIISVGKKLWYRPGTASDRAFISE